MSQHCEKWLADVEAHLNSVSAEELEAGYLAVRDGAGETIEACLERTGGIGQDVAPSNTNHTLKQDNG